MININYQENYILAQATRMNQKTLIGKSQIIYKCKYRYIYKIIKNKNALNPSNNLYAIIYLREFLSRQ